MAAASVGFPTGRSSVPEAFAQLFLIMATRLRLYQSRVPAVAIASSLCLPMASRSNGPLPAEGSIASRAVPVLPLRQRRLVLRGDRDFLRALRAAEMAEWEASGGDFAQSSTEPQPAGGGFAGSKVTLAAAAAGNPSHDLPF